MPDRTGINMTVKRGGIAQYAKTSCGSRVFQRTADIALVIDNFAGYVTHRTIRLLPANARRYGPVIIEIMNKTRAHRVGCQIVPGRAERQIFIFGIGCGRQFNVRAIAEASRIAFLNKLIVTDIQLQLRAWLNIPVQRHGKQLTAQRTVIQIPFTFLIQHIHAIAKTVVIINVSAQINMPGEGAPTLITQSDFAQRLFRWAFGDKIKLPGRTCRAVQRASQAVEHIQAFQHLNGESGG